MLLCAGGPKQAAAETSRDFSNENAQVSDDGLCKLRLVAVRTRAHRTTQVNAEYLNAVHCHKVVRSYNIKSEVGRESLCCV